MTSSVVEFTTSMPFTIMSPMRSNCVPLSTPALMVTTTLAHGPLPQLGV